MKSKHGHAGRHLHKGKKGKLMAHASHHANNKAHMTPNAFGGADDSYKGGEKASAGAPTMASNCCHS